jgi:GntR family transcriptional regulator, rspAB operon transcriptional repressor
MASIVILKYQTVIRRRDARGEGYMTLSNQSVGRTIKKMSKTKPTPAGKPVQKKARSAVSLDMQAYEAIKERILTLFFLPGQYVNEGAVATMLKLGRTPVHHALQRLQIEGLVEIIPRKGVVIRPDSVAEILKILESRETVEPDLARNAAEHAPMAEMGALRALARAVDQSEETGAVEAFTRADRAFHARVAALSGNPVLAEFAGRLHDRSTRFWYLHLWQTMDPEATAREHSAIADAIAARDSAAAAAAMRDHIGRLKERVTKIQLISSANQLSLSRGR